MTPIALLLCGELRTFPTLLAHFENALLTPLRPADVFLHVDLAWSTASWSNLSGLPRPPPVLPSSTIDMLRERLKPVWVQVTEEASAAHYAFVRWRETFDAMRKWEERSGVLYSHVVRVRPDLVYHCRIARSWLTQIRLPLLSWDAFAAFPRASAETILSRAAETFECTTRLELCVPGAIVRLANSSYYDIAANAGTHHLMSIYRQTDCPPDLPRCDVYNRRTRCAPRLCNDRQAAADASITAGAPSALPACDSKGHIISALRKPIGLAAFRSTYLYHVRGNPWCQCRVPITSREQAMASSVDATGAARYYTSPCMSEDRPHCCKFGGSSQTYQSVVRDAAQLAYPTGCSPWFEDQRLRAQF